MLFGMQQTSQEMLSLSTGLDLATQYYSWMLAEQSQGLKHLSQGLLSLG